MFWHLLLAHFIADYPLQPNWMARNKTRLWILLLHVSTHFLVMLAVFLPLTGQVWPYLLALATIHFLIDSGKNWLTIHRRDWVAWPYLADQAFHIVSIGAISLWISSAMQSHQPLYLPRQAAIIATGFLLVTYVYLISERVLSSGAVGISAEQVGRPWARLLIRGALLAALLLGWNSYHAALPSLFIQMPYPATRQGARALISDLLFTVLVAVIVILMT